MTLNIQSMGHQPRFGAIALHVDTTQNRGLPSATAYVGDYNNRGFGDGDIVVVTPSGKVEPLVTNNRLVDAFTKAVRSAGGFVVGTPGPTEERIRVLARPVFKELRAMFQQGELPMSGSADGNALYTRLFEQERPVGTKSVERLLCEALGYHFVSPNPSNPDMNNRYIFTDKTGRAFQLPEAPPTPLNAATEATMPTAPTDSPEAS